MVFSFFLIIFSRKSRLSRFLFSEKLWLGRLLSKLHPKYFSKNCPLKIFSKNYLPQYFPKKFSRKKFQKLKFTEKSVATVGKSDFLVEDGGTIRKGECTYASSKLLQKKPLKKPPTALTSANEVSELTPWKNGCEFGSESQNERIT